MPLCTVIILIKEVTEWCHLISSFCLPCFISLTTVSKCVPRLCSSFHCSSLRHSVTHQQETTTTKNLHVWPNDLSTIFQFRLAPFCDDRMGNTWRQVPYLPTIYIQDRASFGYLLSFIYKALYNFDGTTPEILYSLFLFYYCFSFSVAGENRKRWGQSFRWGKTFL